MWVLFIRAATSFLPTPRSQAGPGLTTATRCPLVASMGTAGRKKEAGPGQRVGVSGRLTQVHSQHPHRGREYHPAAPPNAQRSRARVRRPQEGQTGPSLTTWSGPGTRHSSRAAQRSRSEEAQALQGERGSASVGGQLLQPLFPTKDLPFLPPLPAQGPALYRRRPR